MLPTDRRRFLLGAGAAATAAGTLGSAAAGVPQPVRDHDGATIMGPRNVPLERQNPDSLAPPATDAGELPNLKFSFDQAHNRLTPGGWAREVTMRDLPVATTIAGVDMRLRPGAIRELHWHPTAEWAIMLAGQARVTAIDAEGRNFIGDLGLGDLWFFPAGLPHSIQALQDGCEFLIVFDDGNFSEFDTFLLTDWFAHVPRGVLALNFGVPASAFAHIPTDPARTRYIFPGAVPPPLAQDVVAAPAGTVPNAFTYPLSRQAPIQCPGGRVWIVDSSNFPASTAIAAALVEVDPGGMRELHWHPNADEWQYYLTGSGRMTVFGANGTANTFDYQAGDVGYVPVTMGHSIENTGGGPLRFLELLRADRFEDVSLNQWLALTPPELVERHLNISRATFDRFDKRKQLVVRR